MKILLKRARFLKEKTLALGVRQIFRVKSYPIPFTNQLTVSLYLLHNSDVELLVYDITGKQVHAKTIDNVSFGKNEIVFEDIQFLQSGNYLLKINVTNQLGTYFKVSNILKK